MLARPHDFTCEVALADEVGARRISWIGCNPRMDRSVSGRNWALMDLTEVSDKLIILRTIETRS